MSIRRVVFCAVGAVLATAASTLLGITGAGASAIAVPQYTLEERAAAIASPSLIYVEFQFSGYVRRRDTGEALHSSPIVITNRCSGFVVSAQGHAVTHQYCLQRTPESAINSAAPALASEMIKAGKVAADQKDVYTKELIATTVFSGSSAGTEPTRTVFGQLFQGRPGLSAEPAVPGEIVGGQSNDSDTVLLKFVLNGMPVVEIGEGHLTTNDNVVLVGFGTNDNATPVTYVSRSRTAKVTGRYGAGTPPIYQMDGDAGSYSLGGMVVDPGGRAVGMINFDPTTRDRTTRLITSATQIKKVLTDAGASNALTATDQVYREGLDAYFGGRYSESIDKLGKVIALMPDHVVASSYRQNASSRLAIEGDPGTTTTTPGWLIALTATLGGALLLSLVAIMQLVIRNRVQADQLRQRLMLDAYAPVSGIPVSVLPISPDGDPYRFPSSPWAPSPESQEPEAGSESDR